MLSGEVGLTEMRIGSETNIFLWKGPSVSCHELGTQISVSQRRAEAQIAELTKI